ncbi:ferredoxin [Kitasatospora sp. NPDC048545]|uniref:ferredoxin n=1 Tax=Kitasatospora sp. NPDC048545 TaxID=3157208 RepID=UPI0033FC6DDD
MSGTASTVRVSVDSAHCIGAGQCVLAAPTVFSQWPSDGRARILDRQPSGTQAVAVRLAVRHCPVQAIQLIESGVGQ